MCCRRHTQQGVVSSPKQHSSTVASSVKIVAVEGSAVARSASVLAGKIASKHALLMVVVDEGGTTDEGGATTDLSKSSSADINGADSEFEGTCGELEEATKLVVLATETKGMVDGNKE